MDFQTNGKIAKSSSFQKKGKECYITEILNVTIKNTFNQQSFKSINNSAHEAATNNSKK